MPSEITMPKLSDTMTEGTLVKWHRKEGDKVQAGDEIADVETDKATMPMEAFDDGVLALVAIAEGQKVKVGARIAVIATAGEDPAAVRSQFQSAGPSQAESADTEPVPPAGTADQRVPAATVTAPAAVDVDQAGDQRLKVSPLARKIAAEHRIDLSRMKGTGPGGRIVERDVRQALEQPRATSPAAAAPVTKAPAAPPPVILTGQTQKIALTKMRATIAQRLQQSKQQVPHFYETADIDMEQVVALRQRLNEKLEKDGIRLSIADFVYKAVAAALVRHPALNAHFDGAEITRFGDVNLGIAVGLPDGLIVPVLRGANQMGLRELRQRSVDLAERARVQRLKPEELSGATFTISSLGSQGVREFSAIINPPEVAILAVGSASPRPVVYDGQILPRTVMTVTLSADHRVVDGAVAAEFLKTLREMLEEPGFLLV